MKLIRKTKKKWRQVWILCFLEQSYINILFHSSYKIKIFEIDFWFRKYSWWKAQKMHKQKN